jgi:hypothetical protein
MSRSNHEESVPASHFYEVVAEGCLEPSFIHVFESVSSGNRQSLHIKSFFTVEKHRHRVTIVRPCAGNVTKSLRTSVQPMQASDGEESVRTGPKALVFSMPGLPFQLEITEVVIIRWTTS